MSCFSFCSRPSVRKKRQERKTGVVSTARCACIACRGSVHGSQSSPRCPSPFSMRETTAPPTMAAWQERRTQEKARHGSRHSCGGPSPQGTNSTWRGGELHVRPPTAALRACLSPPMHEGDRKPGRGCQGTCIRFRAYGHRTACRILTLCPDDRSEAIRAADLLAWSVSVA